MKALALLSGGLDSTLAVKSLLNQRIEVVAVNFTSPFCMCRKGGCGAVEVAKQLKVPVKHVILGEDYLEMVRNPKHGYGRHLNPCIDCRIFMLKRAKKYAEEVGASFIFTGEVLGERPMSQHRQALNKIEAEAGLKGKMLRPLSAKLLPVTEAEKEGWVDRSQLFAFSGRSRRRQLELAAQYQIREYACPAGGCLLTHKEFAAKLKDLFNHETHVDIRDINLLKIGRHFRFRKNKIVVGRNERENQTLLTLKQEPDYVFQVTNCGSPITLLKGPKTEAAVKKSAVLTLHYSDSQEDSAAVAYGKEGLENLVIVSKPRDAEVEKLRINKSCE